MKKPAAKKKSKTTKVKPLHHPNPSSGETVAEYCVSNKLWHEIDMSLYIHGMEPVDSNAYYAIQLEAGRTERIEELIDMLGKTMDYHFNLTPKQEEKIQPLEEAIDEIYADVADDVLHVFLDGKDSAKYLKPASEDVVCPECGVEHNEEDFRQHTECADCDEPFKDDEDSVWYNGTADVEGGREGEMLCLDCFEARPNVWSVCYQGDDGNIKLVKEHLFDDGDKAKVAGKSLSAHNKGRLFMVSDSKGEELTTRFIEDIPLVLPDGLAEKKEGAFGQLMMFGGAMLGAGLASAAMGGSSGVRVAVPDSEEITEAVVEAAKEVGQ